MAIAERTAETTWEGPLAGGSGTIRPASGALGKLPVTWASRTGQPGGKTSPEELAAAHSSCFAMALALRLSEHKAAAQRLTVAATVTLDEVDGHVHDHLVPPSGSRPGTRPGRLRFPGGGQ